MLPFISFLGFISLIELKAVWLLRSIFSEFNEVLIKLMNLPIIQLFNKVSDIFHALRKAVNVFYIAALKELSDP